MQNKMEQLKIQTKGVSRLVEAKADDIEFKNLANVVKYMPKNEDLVDLYNKIVP